MKDIEIKISQETRMVDLKKTVIGNDAENLQGNLIFSFTDNFVNGTARLEYEIAGNKRYIMLEKNNNTYSVPIKSVLTKKGQINMQLVITEGTSENDIPVFKSNIFYVFCNQSINAEIEQPDEYPSWIEIANAKINEVDEAILGIGEAKRYAIEQGDYAKEQGDYAKAQGDYAKTQKIEVVKANEEANKIISDFEKNVDEYTANFNENAENKTNDFDSNASEKLSVYNTNADTKLQEYNTNADNKIAEYDLHSQELDNKIIATRNELERVKNDVLETGTDTDTYIHLEDSAMAEYQELSVDGVCKQETTSVSAGDEYDSPSPDHPQPISTIENSLKITSCNKNLLDDTKLVITSGNGAKKIDSEGKITSIDPINDGRGYDYKYCDYFFTLGKGSYYLYYEIITPTANANAYINIYNGNNRIYVSNFANKTGIISTKFTLEDFSNMGIEFKLFDGEIRLWILKDGVQDTSYEQHLETQIEANLPEGEFIGKINDTYKDTLKVEYNETDGQYHLILNKMIGKVVLDGSENYNKLSGVEYNTYYIDNLINAYRTNNTINYCSNYFISITNDQRYKDKTFFINSNNRILISYNEITTVDEFKTWLSTHNTEVYYVLANPYVVDLGIVDQLITYNEITNLFTDSDLMPQINAKYYRNFISTVRNLQVNEKALKQELIDINTRLSVLESASTNVASESEVIE